VAELSAAFGVLGMLLAAVGLYGATAHMARSRRREIGLRIALGAQRSDIVRLMLRENVWIILAGTAIGLAGAVAVGRVIESLLFGITPTDPLTLGTAAVLLGLVALMSSLWPALRASRLNPLESLRYE
jgi:ABC-type antimicrobial peptide transport system permease subunit